MPDGRFLCDLRNFSSFGLGLLKTETPAAFLPFTALLEKVDPLETLENVALRSDFTGTFKRCVLAHCLFFLSTAV
jgi:hypothetical protein